MDALKTLPTRIAALEVVVDRLETPVGQFSTARALALWTAIATVLASVGQPVMAWISSK